jgi:hypothetical protein
LAKNCGGFSGTYQALCDFYGIPVRADICWDMDNLLPANHVKKFNMKEFEQVTSLFHTARHHRTRPPHRRTRAYCSPRFMCVFRSG